MVIQNGYDPSDMLYVFLVIMIVFVVYHVIEYIKVKIKIEKLHSNQRMKAYDKTIKKENMTSNLDEEDFDVFRELRL